MSKTKESPAHTIAKATPPTVLELALPAGLQTTAPQDEIVLTAQHKITLQCGQASITLHPNGTIALKGEYILSEANGTNRLVGGQIEFN